MTNHIATIDERKAAILEGKAKHYGLPPEALLLESIDNLITQPKPDFEQAMKHVHVKNLELYIRLA
jgi:hypothetical protein